MICLKGWLLILASSCAFAAERVVIHEIHFDPKDKRPLEFVELFNAGDAPAKLDGWKLDKFIFPAGTTLDAGAYIIVAQDAAALEKEFAVKALGPFLGKLSNEGEKIVLADSKGRTVESIKYGVGFPWPTASAGIGSSLERIHPLADASRPGHWRASGFGDAPPAAQTGVFVPPGSSGWKWRKGDSEPGAWTALEYKEDAAWSPGKAGLGYGDDDDATVLGDMQGRYGCAFFRQLLGVNHAHRGFSNSCLLPPKRCLGRPYCRTWAATLSHGSPRGHVVRRACVGRRCQRPSTRHTKRRARVHTRYAGPAVVACRRT